MENNDRIGLENNSDNDIKESVTERLKKVRTLLGFTQKEMAVALHLKRTSYASVEQGHNRVTYRHINLMREKLGVNSEYIIGGTGEAFLNNTGDIKSKNNTFDDVEALKRELSQAKEDLELYKRIIKKIVEK